MNLSTQEAAAALAQVEAARVAMRRAVQAHRGHIHLWIWGTAWVAMPLLAHFGGDRMARYFGWVVLAGTVASVWAGRQQGQRIRQPLDRRFLGMIAALVGFGMVFPIVLFQGRQTAMSMYAYTCLVAMQVYVIAGLWADIYLLWVGLLVTALILAGYFLAPGIFWPWMAVCGGGSLLATGFYVRFSWR